jgi:hypothetical protein
MLTKFQKNKLSSFRSNINQHFINFCNSYIEGNADREYYIIASEQVESALHYCKINEFDRRLSLYFNKLINWHLTELLEIFSRGNNDGTRKDKSSRNTNKRTYLF